MNKSIDHNSCCPTKLCSQSATIAAAIWVCSDIYHWILFVHWWYKCTLKKHYVTQWEFHLPQYSSQAHGSICVWAQPMRDDISFLIGWVHTQTDPCKYWSICSSFQSFILTSPNILQFYLVCASETSSRFYHKFPLCPLKKKIRNFPYHLDDYFWVYIDGLVPERCNSSALDSSANALELRLSCTKPSIFASVAVVLFNSTLHYRINPTRHAGA